MSRLTGEFAPADEVCAVCGLAVGGWAVGVTHDGRRTWDRPAYKAQNPGGSEYTGGGLTHVEGGERCTPSVVVVAAEMEPEPDPDRVIAIGAARAKLALAGATFVSGFMRQVAEHMAIDEIEALIAGSIQRGDLQGVEVMLRLLAIKNPHRAQVVLDTIELGLDLARRPDHEAIADALAESGMA